MKLSKIGVASFVTIGAVLAIFNAAVFTILFVRNEVFWAAYAFTTVSFAIQPFVINYASLHSGNNTKSRIYKISVMRVSILYLSLQYPLGIISMIMSYIIPFWTILGVYVAILIIAVIGLVPAKAVENKL